MKYSIKIREIRLDPTRYLYLLSKLFYSQEISTNTKEYIKKSAFLLFVFIKIAI